MDAVRLSRIVEAFLARQRRGQVTLEGEAPIPLAETQYAVEVVRGKVLLHLWSERHNRVRRIVGVREETPQRLRLEVARFGATEGEWLEVNAPGEAGKRERDRRLARLAYRRRVARLLERFFRAGEVEGLSTAADLRRSFSALYTRARVRERNRWWAVLGVNEGEDASAIDGLLTYGLIWFDWNRQRHPERVWAGLRLLVPAGQAEAAARRIPFLDREHIRVELYELGEDGVCRLWEPVRGGNLDTRVEPAGRALEVQRRERAAAARIRALDPGAIEPVVLAGGDEVVLRFRGLPFARVDRGEVWFGVEGELRRLAPGNYEPLKKLVARLGRERRAGGRVANALYRRQAERWLESKLVEDPAALDARLDRGGVHRQVVVAAGLERGVADLVGVTREGRLVVVEIKAASDIQLPLQGLDYWMRVALHHERGEVAGSGHFPKHKLRPGAPELLLVAPALQFHPTAETVVGYLSREVPVTLVGLGEDWRRSVQVVWRRRR